MTKWECEKTLWRLRIVVWGNDGYHRWTDITSIKLWININQMNKRKITSEFPDIWMIHLVIFTLLKKSRDKVEGIKERRRQVGNRSDREEKGRSPGRCRRKIASSPSSYMVDPLYLCVVTIDYSHKQIRENRKLGHGKGQTIHNIAACPLGVWRLDRLSRECKEEVSRRRDSRRWFRRRRRDRPAMSTIDGFEGEETREEGSFSMICYLSGRTRPLRGTRKK